METIGTLHVRKNNKDYINSYELELGENIIGRPSKEKPSTIEIKGDDENISRQHFFITVSQNKDKTFKYMLRDYSLNGTQIVSGKKKKNLSKNEEFLLHNGDIINVGKNTFLELEISTVEPEKPTEKIPKSVDGIISVPITQNGKKVYVAVACKDILYIKADGNYAKLYVETNENYVMYMTKSEREEYFWATENLKYFENLLNDEDYIVRIHDSYIINIKKRRSYNTEVREGTVTLINGKSLPVSRNYKKLLEEKIAI